MYECFHCGQKTVAWQCDYSFEDIGLEGEGIVQCLHCNNCGAEIEYYVPLEVAEPCNKYDDRIARQTDEIQKGVMEELRQ